MNTAGFPAILVDWADYTKYERLREWIARKAEHAEIVLLVSDANETEATENELFSVVIKNNLGLRGKQEFYSAAINAVKLGSNLYPVVLLLDDQFVSAEACDEYLSQGVLVLMSARWPA